jgi:hypothetical protein
MKDGVSPSARSADPLPTDPGQRLPYVEPKVIVFGDLVALTRAVGNHGNVDGGVQPFNMLSGV